MKLDKNKEFWNISNTWYQRTISLLEIWQNNEESEKRRLKALSLWIIMFERISHVTQKAIEMSKPKPIKNIHGHPSGLVGEAEEVILTPGNEQIILPPTSLRFGYKEKNA